MCAKTIKTVTELILQIVMHSVSKLQTRENWFQN